MARLLKKLHALSGSSTHHCSMHRWTVDIICWNYSSAGWKSTMFNYHLEGTANHILDRSSSFHFSLHFRVPWLMSHSPHDSPMAPKKCQETVDPSVRATDWHLHESAVWLSAVPLSAWGEAAKPRFRDVVSPWTSGRTLKKKMGDISFWKRLK